MLKNNVMFHSYTKCHLTDIFTAVIIEMHKLHLGQASSRDWAGHSPVLLQMVKPDFFIAYLLTKDVSLV
jgi:hypothetical protein